MAGEWIKVTTNIHTKPEVFKLARLLNVSVDITVGALVRFWCWADQITVDGRVDGIASTDVDAVVDRAGFCDGLLAVGWLEKDGEEGFIIPNFSRHNGDSAKKRHLKTERQARWRAGKDVDAKATTRPSTREEKSREEKKENQTPLSGKPDDLPPEDTPQKPNHRAIARELLDFLNEKAGRAYKPVDSNLDVIVARLKEGYTAAECRQVIAKKVREWSGNEDMELYLRPETLFGKKKMASYSGELIVPKEGLNA